MIDLIRKIIYFLVPSSWLALLIKSRIFYSITSKIPLSNYHFSTALIKKIKRRGIQLNIDLKDFVGWFIYYNLKDPIVDCISNQLNEGDVFIDIGGNIGFLGLLAAKVSGEKGRVIAFEPNPVTRAKYVDNIRQNPFRNIEVFPFALGEKAGSAKLHVADAHNLGMVGLTPSDEDIHSSQTVDVITLDDFTGKNNISKVDFLKIDVEGYEPYVLKGAAEIIERHKPKIAIEVDNNLLKKNQSSAVQLLETLTSKGYTVYFAGGNLVEITNFTAIPEHFDALAIYKGTSSA